jgi:hypothetical protein
VSGGLTVTRVPAVQTVTPAIQSESGEGEISAKSSASAPSVSPQLPNPRTVVAPGLDRVVLEFFNSSGALTNSIPSQRQLEAYRLAAVAGRESQDVTSVAA